MTRREIATAVALALWLAVPADDDSERYAEAIRLLEAQRFAAARPLLESYVERHPDHVVALAWLAYAQVSLADSQAALATTGRALALAPEMGPLWYHRGRALLLEHDFAAADAALASTARFAPDFFPGWRSHFQALAALGLGDEPRARALYARSPESAEPWADPAFLFERMATLFPIVPEAEPARGWFRRAAAEHFVGDKLLPPLELAPPVRGEWLVSQGNFGDESHFGIAGSFGFDLGRTVGGRLTAKVPATARTSDWFTYDAPVVAPADAEVVRVVDGLPDNAATVADRAPLAAPEVRGNPLGNHVVLRLGERAFLLLAHLRAGSISVEAGERVASGAELGRIGQSGISYAPHLHLTALSSLEPPIGRPMRFRDAVVRAADGRERRDGAQLPAAGELLITR